MKTSKRIFFIMAALFGVIMVWLAYDISTKTTFPWNKSFKEVSEDSLSGSEDSLRINEEISFESKDSLSKETDQNKRESN